MIGAPMPKQKNGVTRRKTRGTTARLDEAGEAAIFDRIAEGEPLGKIAASYGLCRDSVYNWIKAGGPAREERWNEAKVRSADALAEQAGDVLDEAVSVTTSAEASIARARSDYRRWLAQVRSAEYRDQPTVAVFNLGQLHLDALRAIKSRNHVPELIQDAEVIEE
jgi:hypothetical protein